MMNSFKITSLPMKKFYMYDSMSTCKSWLLKVAANGVLSSWKASPSRDITLHADNLVVIEPEPKHTCHAQGNFGQTPESRQTPRLHSEGSIWRKGYPVHFASAASPEEQLDSSWWPCPTDLLLVQSCDMAYTMSSSLVQQCRPLTSRKDLNIYIKPRSLMNYSLEL